MKDWMDDALEVTALLALVGGLVGIFYWVFSGLSATT